MLKKIVKPYLHCQRRQGWRCLVTDVSETNSNQCSIFHEFTSSNHH
jgi:hypothetical protein